MSPSRSALRVAVLTASLLPVFGGARADDFPRFIVPGEEQAMTLLDELHAHHHARASSDCTLWDGWLPHATLWAAEPPRQHYQASFLRRRIDDEGYVRAYRAAGSRTDRERQLELVEHIGRALDRLVRQPLLGGLLGAMEGPARMAGLSAMHAFLGSGFRVFKTMKGADVFLRTVIGREQALMARIWAGEADPIGRAGQR
jgi:hypothetical protein